MPHPFQPFVDLIEKTNISSPTSLILFAKINSRLEDELQENLLLTYINLPRAKQGKAPKTLEELGGDDIMPFKVGLIGHYLQQENKDCGALAEKVAAIEEALSQLFKENKNKPIMGLRADEIERYRITALLGPLEFMRDDPTLAPEDEEIFPLLNNSVFQNPAVKIENLFPNEQFWEEAIDKTEEEIRRLDAPLNEIKNLLLILEEQAKQEQKRLLKKVVGNQKSFLPSLSYQREKAANANLFTEYFVQIHTLRNKLSELSRPAPLAKDYPTKQDYYFALQHFNSERVAQFKVHAKSSVEQTHALEQAIYSNLTKKPPLSTFLRTGLSKIFEKLHHYFPSAFLTKEPDFLKTTAQKTAEAIKEGSKALEEKSRPILKRP